MMYFLETDVSAFCQDLAPILKLIKNGLFPILQIGIPIILIVLGMIDLGKAVMAGKEDEMKKAQSALLKRCIYAVAVFFVVTIVTLIFNLFATSGATKGDNKIEGTASWSQCWNYID